MLLYTAICGPYYTRKWLHSDVRYTYECHGPSAGYIPYIDSYILSTAHMSVAGLYVYRDHISRGPYYMRVTLCVAGTILQVASSVGSRDSAFALPVAATSLLLSVNILSLLYVSQYCMQAYG